MHTQSEHDTSTGIPRLPAEITDAIIGFVGPDAQALCACSLVCRDWVNASRHTLFSSIALDSKRCDRLVDQIILRPSSRIHPYLSKVRELVLVGIYFDTQAGFLIDKTFGGGPFHALAGHLPNVRALSLVAFDFRQTLHPRAHMAVSRFSDVRFLEIKNCTFPSFHSFRRIVIALVSLHHLNMICPAWDVGPTSAHLAALHEPDGRPALQSFELAVANHGASHAKVLIEWLLGTPARLSLRELKLFALDCPSKSPLWAPYSNLLESLPSVSVLTVCAFENEGTPAPLRYFTLLEDLEISRFDRSLLQPINWDVVCEMLRQVRSPLRRLRFTINRLNQSDADADPEDVSSPSINVEGLELLDPILAQPQFRHLELVKFAVQDTALPIGVATIPTFSCVPIIHDLRKHLPKLYARGIVRVALTKTAPLHPAITGNIPGFFRAVMPGMPEPEAHSNGQ